MTDGIDRGEALNAQGLDAAESIHRVQQADPESDRRDRPEDPEARRKRALRRAPGGDPESLDEGLLRRDEVRLSPRAAELLAPGAVPRTPEPPSSDAPAADGGDRGEPEPPAHIHVTA